MLKPCQGRKKFKSGYWFFTKLLQCNSMQEINKFFEKWEASVPDHALEYLSRVNNTSQYPGARCKMGEDVYMYGLTASSGNELMNNANQRAMEHHRVDLVVATMILMDLASVRYKKLEEGCLDGQGHKPNVQGATEEGGSFRK